jgi:hypothetical protein
MVKLGMANSRISLSPGTLPLECRRILFEKFSGIHSLGAKLLGLRSIRTVVRFVRHNLQPFALSFAQARGAFDGNQPRFDGLPVCHSRGTPP